MQLKDENVFTSRSYFWDCITFSKECPFLTSNSKLKYFGIALIGTYSAFLLMIIFDLKFYWSLDTFQQQISDCVNYVKKKVKYVEVNQQSLVSTKDKTVRQLKRSAECKRVVNVFRGALAANIDFTEFHETGIETPETDESLEDRQSCVRFD